MFEDIDSGSLPGLDLTPSNAPRSYLKRGRGIGATGSIDNTALGFFNPSVIRLGGFGLRFFGRFFIILNEV